MYFTEKTLKWAMRLYPPFFFQRIWVQKFHTDFKGVDVKIHKSLFNKNYNHSIFGGTIFAAADPFYAVLFDRIFKKKGYQVRVWLKSAQVNYLKPGRSNLYFSIQIKEEEIQEAQHTLDTAGKFIKTFAITIVNKKGETCATLTNEVYIRNLYSGEAKTSPAY